MWDSRNCGIKGVKCKIWLFRPQADLAPDRLWFREKSHAHRVCCSTTLAHRGVDACEMLVLPIFRTRWSFPAPDHMSINKQSWRHGHPSVLLMAITYSLNRLIFKTSHLWVMGKHRERGNISPFQYYTLAFSFHIVKCGDCLVVLLLAQWSPTSLFRSLTVYLDGWSSQFWKGGKCRSTKKLHYIVWPAGTANAGCKKTKNDSLSLRIGPLNSNLCELVRNIFVV